MKLRFLALGPILYLLAATTTGTMVTSYYIIRPRLATQASSYAVPLARALFPLIIYACIPASIIYLLFLLVFYIHLKKCSKWHIVMLSLACGATLGSFPMLFRSQYLWVLWQVLFRIVGESTFSYSIAWGLCTFATIVIIHIAFYLIGRAFAKLKEA